MPSARVPSRARRSFSSTRARCFPATLPALLLAGLILPSATRAQEQRALPSIEEHTAGMRKLDGFFPLYWDAAAGQLFMEVPRLGAEVLHSVGMGAGLGSNDIGIDRGGTAGSRIVEFERVGRRVLMVQPNYQFRSSSDNPAEVRAVRDAFARSVLWGFTAAAATGDRVLVEMNDFLLRDA